MRCGLSVRAEFLSLTVLVLLAGAAVPRGLARPIAAPAAVQAAGSANTDPFVSQSAPPAGETDPPPAEADGASAQPDDKPASPPRRHGGQMGAIFGPDVFPRLLGNPVQPIAADRAPLQPGEIDELLAFAQQNLPTIGRQLSMLRAANPRLFERKANEWAPRLRWFRRISTDHPRLADILRRHAENALLMRRLLGQAEAAQDPNRRAAIIDEFRRRMRGNLQLEIAAIRERNADLLAGIDKAAASMFDHFADPQTPADQVPAPLRRLVDSYRAAADAPSRDTLRSEALSRIGERLRQDIFRQNARADQLEQNINTELDARAARFEEELDRRASEDKRDGALTPRRHRTKDQPADKPGGNNPPRGGEESGDKPEQDESGGP